MTNTITNNATPSERIEIVKYYLRKGMGLKTALFTVRTMTDEEIQEKLEFIAEHTRHNYRR